ncbi:unnamed protein product, partial [Mesorhabditis spiculigera]
MRSCEGNACCGSKEGELAQHFGTDSQHPGARAPYTRHTRATFTPRPPRDNCHAMEATWRDEQNPTVHGLGDDFFTEQRIIAAIAVMSPVFIPFGACLVVIVLWYNCVARRIQRQIEKADKQRQPSSLRLTASQDTLQDPPPTIRIDQ